MTTMTITYDGRNKAARAIAEMLRSMDFIHISEPASRPKNSVDRSLAEFERGETTVCDTFEDYLKSIEA
jgi:hypothetical protein